MPHYRRCREKFHAAVFRLAVAEGDVRERLKGAYRYLRMLHEDELPPNLRGEWIDILKAITRRGPEIGPDSTIYQSAVDHTLAKMRNSTGRRIAERIVMLDRELH